MEVLDFNQKITFIAQYAALFSEKQYLQDYTTLLKTGNNLKELYKDNFCC